MAKKNPTTIEELLQKQTAILESWLRPHIIVDVYPREFVNILHFRIRNVGKTPGYHINLDSAPPLPINEKLSKDFRLFQQEIPALGPGEEISFFWDSALDLFSKEDEEPQVYEITLIYQDVESQQYQQTIVVDPELLRGLAIELPGTDKVLSELKSIRKGLEKIARYTEDLRLEKIRDRMNSATDTENGDKESGKES